MNKLIELKGGSCIINEKLEKEKSYCKQILRIDVIQQQ